MIYNKGGVYTTQLVLGTNADICPTGDQGTVKNEADQGGKGEEQEQDMEKKEEKNILKIVRKLGWDKLHGA